MNQPRKPKGRPSARLADRFLDHAGEEAPALAKRLRPLDAEGKTGLAGVLGRFHRSGADQVLRFLPRTSAPKDPASKRQREGLPLPLFWPHLREHGPGWRDVLVRGLDVVEDDVRVKTLSFETSNPGVRPCGLVGYARKVIQPRDVFATDVDSVADEACAPFPECREFIRCN